MCIYGTARTEFFVCSILRHGAPLKPLNTIVLLWSEGGLSSGDASLSDSCTPDCL